MFNIKKFIRVKSLLIGALLVLVLFIFRLMVFEYYMNKVPAQIELDLNKWRNEPINRKSSIRFKMWRSLQETNYINYTRKRQEILDLLGQPELTNKIDVNQQDEKRSNDQNNDTILNDLYLDLSYSEYIEEVSDFYFLGPSVNPIEFKYVYLNLEYENDSLVQISVITDMDYFD